MNPRITFWSIVFMVLTWVSITLVIETSLGFPATNKDWQHRMIGWFVNFVALRTFYKGVRRYSLARQA